MKKEKTIKPAKHVYCDFAVRNEVFHFSYIIDKSDKGVIEITFPFSIKKFSQAYHRLLASSCAAVVGSLVLAEEIEMSWSGGSNFFEEIVTSLYDIRTFSEGVDYINPNVLFAKKSTRQVKKYKDLKDSRAVLSWSGGIDSSLSLLLLKKNKFTVYPFFTDINIHQKSHELESIERLSKQLEVTCERVNVWWPKILEHGKKYSNKFDHFPEYNAIPFGRDFIHSMIGLFFAKQYDAKNICFGHEHELWKNDIKIDGKVIERNDMQNERNMKRIENMAKDLLPQITFVSPIAGLSKYAVYEMMATNYLSVLQNTTTCYFKKRCGQCNNCKLMEVIEELYAGEDTITFSDFKHMLSFKNTVKKETFQTMIYVYYYDWLQKYKTDKRFIELIQNKYGDIMHLSKQEAMDLLLVRHKNMTIPLDFVI